MIIARFVPVVRTFVPFIAGVGRMPRVRFTFYNVISALIWTGGIVTVGALFGGIPFVARYIELITIGLAACSVIQGAIAVARWRNSARRDSPKPADHATLTT